MKIPITKTDTITVTETTKLPPVKETKTLTPTPEFPSSPPKPEPETITPTYSASWPVESPLKTTDEAPAPPQKTTAPEDPIFTGAAVGTKLSNRAAFIAGVGALLAVF